jgi:threonine/homoserine/homoserine lactone efflux protein
LSLSFLLTTLVVVITPGTGVLLTLSAGLAHGRRAGLLVATGGTLATVPHLTAALTGLAALLHRSPTAFAVLQYAGAAYLVHLGIATLRTARAALPVDTVTAPPPGARLLLAPVLRNVLNPKLTLFCLAFLPAFVPPDTAHPFAAMLPLALVFMGMTFLALAAYACAAASVRRHVLARPAFLTGANRAFGGSFVALGATLALS